LIHLRQQLAGTSRRPIEGESVTDDLAARWFVKHSMPKGFSMAFRPNYGMQRSDRNRAAQARSEEKKKKREEKSAQRQAERAEEIIRTPGDETALQGEIDDGRRI
jgi:hypothetical protein